MEKQVLYHTGRFTTTDEDGEGVLKLEEPKFEEGTFPYNLLIYVNYHGESLDGSDMGAEDGAEWVSEVSYFQNESVAAPFVMICVKGQGVFLFW